MPLRHKVYCKRNLAAVTPEMVFEHLRNLDFLTLGEDYGFSKESVEIVLPLRIKNVGAGAFRRFHLTYGEAVKRPIEIARWETEDERRAAIEETIRNLTIEDAGLVKTIGEFLHASVDDVGVSFGSDPAAAMFAWEVVRYFASEFDGIIKTDDRQWLIIGSDYQARPI